jgi:hypothetical protein
MSHSRVAGKKRNAARALRNNERAGKHKNPSRADPMEVCPEFGLSKWRE